jgi:diguanylate cyclase (GGDEF)-like protein
VPHRPDTDITLANAEQALVVRPGRLRFAPAVEERFEADTGAKRCRRLAAAILIGMIIHLLSLRPNALLLGDVFTLALIVKVGLVAPLFLLCLYVLTRIPSPWLRESIVTTLTIAAMAGQMYLVCKSSSPLAAYAHYPALINIVFANLIVRARFFYACTASTVSLAIYAVGVAQLDSLPFEARTSAVVVLCVGVVCTLYANYQLERDERNAYAIALREATRSGILNSANRELSRISDLDAMTGLANRRGFDRRLEAAWTAARAAGQSIAVLMLDVDHFKRFNDRYGHQAGDLCLKRIAESLRAQLRGGDALVARYGGEEFIAVLRGADLLDGIRAAERVRRGIEGCAIRHELAPTQVVTASIGVAAAAATPDASPKEIIACADAALYEAKRHGRNRIWPPILSSDPASEAVAERDTVADVA